MHLDPNNERTPSNKKRLKLKDFHRRQILGKIIKNLFAKRKVDKPDKPHNYGGSGGNSNKRGCFYYRLESIKKYWSGRRGYGVSCPRLEIKRNEKYFNKQQLPGKLILIGKKYFRICSD